VVLNSHGRDEMSEQAAETLQKYAVLLRVQAGEVPEFRHFIETLRGLGIEYSMNWGPTKEVWQEHLTQAGFHLTALACSVVVVGKEEFLFANGQAQWTDDDRGYGPTGAFLLTRNARTGKVTPRRYRLGVGGEIAGSGFEALKLSYPTVEWLG